MKYLLQAMKKNILTNTHNPETQQKSISIQAGLFNLCYGNGLIRVKFQPKQIISHIYEGFYTNDNLPPMVTSMFQTAQNLFLSLINLSPQTFQFLFQQLIATINPAFNLRMKIKIQLPLQKHVFTKQEILQREIERLQQQNRQLRIQLKQKDLLKDMIDKQSKEIKQLKMINQHYIQLKSQASQDVKKLEKSISQYSEKQKILSNQLSKKSSQVQRHKSQLNLLKKHVHFIDGSDLVKDQDEEQIVDDCKKKVKTQQDSFSTPFSDSIYRFLSKKPSFQSFILQRQNKAITLQTYEIKYNNIKKVKQTSLYQAQLYGQKIVKKQKFILQIRIGMLTNNKFNLGIRKSLQINKFTISSMLKVVSYQNFLNLEQTPGGNRLSSKDTIKIVADFNQYLIELSINDRVRYKQSIQDWKYSDCCIYPWIQLCEQGDYVQILKNKQQA